MYKLSSYPFAIADLQNNSHEVLRRWFLLALLFCLVALTGGCRQSSPQLRVGAYSVNISPLKLPAIRNGGFIQRIEDTVVDPLHARCFVIDSVWIFLLIKVFRNCEQCLHYFVEIVDQIGTGCAFQFRAEPPNKVL